MPTVAPAPPAGPSLASELRRGFLATLPLWSGVIPFAIAFAVLARTAGFSALETQALSMLVFAGSAQVATVTLVAGGAGAAAIVLTTLVLNLRHLLYGLSLSADLPPRARPPRALLAFILTDETYGLAIRDRLDGRGGPAFICGSGLSLYVAFALATLTGSLLGRRLPDPRRLGLDFIFPLVFLALLLPLLRSRRQALVAAVAGLAALALGRVAAGGVVILFAAVAAALLGAALDTRAEGA